MTIQDFLKTEDCEFLDFNFHDMENDEVIWLCDFYFTIGEETIVDFTHLEVKTPLYVTCIDFDSGDGFDVSLLDEGSKNLSYDVVREACEKQAFELYKLLVK
jgi:hypothetical protein